MIKLERVDEMQFTEDNEEFDIDNYLIEIKSGLATRQFHITVDFINQELTGDCVAYGGWFDIDTDECIEIMELFLIDNKPNRDFTHILNKLKK